MNPGFPQLYVYGVVASWRLGAVAQAREWVATLRGHPAFASLAAVRTSMQTTYAPAALAHFEQLMDSLREAGLPER